MYDYLWPVTMAISIVGIIGNIISVVVWKTLKKKMRKTESGCAIYFMLLPAVDTIILMLHLATESLTIAAPSVAEITSYVYFYCYIGHPLYFLAIYFSGFLVVSLTIQRVQMVLKPFKKLKNNIHLQTKVFISFAFLTSFLLNITSFLAYEPVHTTTEIQHNKTNHTHNDNHNDNNSRYKIGKSKMEHKDIMFIIRCIFATGVPTLLILAGNLAICANQKKNNSDQSLMRVNTSTRTDTRHKIKRQSISQTTNKTIYKTLLLITFTTVLFWGLRCINGCMQYIKDTDEVFNNYHVAFQNLAVTIGASVNLLIYYLPGRMFRRTLKDILKNRSLNLNNNLGYSNSRKESTMQLQSMHQNPSVISRYNIQKKDSKVLFGSECHIERQNSEERIYKSSSAQPLLVENGKDDITKSAITLI